mgnify:CR=1 FL=1
MGSSGIALKDEDRHSVGVDRYLEGRVSGLDGIATSRRTAAIEDGDVLSTTSDTEAAQAKTRILQEEVASQGLWFALSYQQRTQFGGHFSEMLLRAVQRQTEST